MAEGWTVAELLRAGWTEADLDWEQLAHATLTALAAGDAAAAQQAAGAALSLAREHFADDDPRLGTALANFAVALPGPNAQRLHTEAAQIWASCGPWIEAMTAPRSAKSSLFHMRMEARHRDTYRQRWAVKWRELADEARVALAAPAQSDPAAAARLDRWRRECPAMLNDTRKLLAAVILLAAP